ncbi:MAG: ABC transporter substrate-binding protein [Lachnospiraceae bacterium]|nr:ABC transporter substrate-binding protein [Lachnospiraceae bacterium]
MKKKCSLLLIAVMFCMMFAACGKEEGMKKIKLTEVAHSIFYAPMYVAIEEGYFEEEGIELTLVNGLGADKTMTAVLSGESEIGFMGSEASVYVYNEGAEDYVINFAQLTQRAGNFLVSREQEPEFKMTDLKGKTVLGGRKGGMPQMVFEYILKKYGMDPATDVNIIQNIDFGMTAQAFAGGSGDYTVEFEPSATALEKDGSGYVVSSLGVESGYVPYTAFSAKKSYIEKNPEVIQGLVNALQKGMDYVNTHTPEEIAAVIQPQFKETDKDTLVTIVTRYYAQHSWKENLVFEEASYVLLLDILESAGELEKRPAYEALVDNTYAKEVAK